MPYKSKATPTDYEQLPIYCQKRTPGYLAKHQSNALKQAIGKNLYGYLEWRLKNDNKR